MNTIFDLVFPLCDDLTIARTRLLQSKYIRKRYSYLDPLVAIELGDCEIVKDKIKKGKKVDLRTFLLILSISSVDTIEYLFSDVGFECIMGFSNEVELLVDYRCGAITLAQKTELSKINKLIVNEVLNIEQTRNDPRFLAWVNRCSSIGDIMLQKFWSERSIPRCRTIIMSNVLDNRFLVWNSVMNKNKEILRTVKRSDKSQYKRIIKYIKKSFTIKQRFWLCIV